MDQSIMDRSSLSTWPFSFRRYERPRNKAGPFEKLGYVFNH